MTASTIQAVKITGEGKYPLVPLKSIEFAERPSDGQEDSILFFNPRSTEGFDEESMADLERTIRTDGLQQPPQVRAIGDGDRIVKLQLIAGERRVRTLRKIVENDLPCFDEDQPAPKKYRNGAIVINRGRFGTVLSHNNSGVTIELIDIDGSSTGEVRENLSEETILPTVSGAKLYGKVPCKVVYNCSDERALRLAFSENDKSKPLDTKDEIVLVQRLAKMGMKQGDIADLLGMNESWVSQTLNFKSSLPSDAYDRLIKGDMTRHVAVYLMGFKPQDRQKLYEAAIAEQQVEFDQKLEQIQEEMEIAEDTEDLALADLEDAQEANDEIAVKKAAKLAKAAAKKALKETEKKEKLISQKGHVKQRHVASAAASKNISPKTAKILPKEHIKEYLIDKLDEYAQHGCLDPVFDCKITPEMIQLVQATARAILAGERDGLSIIRSVQIDLGNWQDNDEVLYDDPVAIIDDLSEDELYSEFSDEDEEPIMEDVASEDYEDAFDE